jgi:hypothetical protein
MKKFLVLISYEVSRPLKQTQKLTRDERVKDWSEVGRMMDLMESDTDGYHQTKVTGVSRG